MKTQIEGFGRMKLYATICLIKYVLVQWSSKDLSHFAHTLRNLNNTANFIITF